MTTSTHEFTAFSRSDLTSLGGAFKKGATIIVPSSEPICISVSDDDSFLSGDGRRRTNNNEQALDLLGQEAEIIANGEEEGNGGQIYAENFFILKDQHGNLYKMVQIEQEGSNSSYFTFVSDDYYSVPAEGAELTVVSRGDVSGDSLNYSSLGVGDKAESETGTIAGRAFFDANNDGIDNPEGGLEGVTVTLLDENGSEVLDGNGNPITATTNARGEYTFNDVPVGQYRVKFDTPEGKEITEQNVGIQDELDSDINSEGISDVFTVVANEATTDIDAGYIEPHVCVTVLEGDTSFRVNFDSHKNIVTEDVWFAQRIIEPPSSARIVGDAHITEGNTQSYRLEFDEALAEDIFVTITINDGSARQAGSSVEEFVVEYSNNTDNFGVVRGETVQYYTVNQEHQDRVEEVWFNDPIYNRDGQNGNADDNYVGIQNLVNDYRIIDSDGNEVSGTTFTVRVPAGSLLSESFQVVANKEVNVGRYQFDFFATETTEDFSLEVSQIGNRTDVDGDITIDIYDVRANVSPIAFDLNGNGEIDVTGNSTSRDHAFTIGARTVEFDLDNDGVVETIEWIQGDGDGFLVDTSEIGPNNEIDGGALFGDEGGTFTDGYEKLAQNDSNNDGLLTGNELNDLAIWVDDGDAVLEDGELRQLSEFGITTLSAQGQNVNVNGEQLLRSETLTDAELTDMVRYSITGVDAEFFQIDELTGEVTYADGFVPDFENPLDEGANNVYDITVVRTGEGLEEPETERLQVKVEDRPENIVDAMDDSAETCFDTAITVDVLSNDMNAASITAVNGQAITEGGEALNINGVLVSLVDGQLVFDGSSAHEDLLFGETAVNTFTYTVSGTDGGEAIAEVEVTFKGATDTLAKVDSLLTDELVGLQVIAEDRDVGNGVGNGAFTARLSDAGDNLNGVFVNAYCLDIFASVQPGGFGGNINDAPLTGATLTVATTDFLSQEQQGFLGTGGINGESAADNLDLINWIINQDFENTDNGDGNNQVYTGAEIQGAIWALTNGEALAGFGEPNGIFVREGLGTDENAQEILDLALANGEDFEAGEGDLVGIFVDPVSSPNFIEPFIIGVDLYEECTC